LVAVAAIIILPLLGVVTTTLYYKQTEVVSHDIKMIECFVPNGERKQLILPDGSSVWLNAGSILIYPEIFSDTRTLYLSGEGNFTVTEDKVKPFIVKTNYIDVEALGTIFNIHSYPDEDETTTMLESGRVRVDDKTGTSGSVILNPNEQLVYNHVDASFKKSNVDVSRLSTWTEGYLIFQQETLGNIFRSLERRYNVKINYNDSKFTSMTFTVRFHAEETLEEALEVLKRIGVDFKYKIINNDVYVQ
jgi:ferric-dicitrate binding protein FerR (iron transport regulator)